MKRQVFVLAVLAAMAVQAVEVTSVVARQRWPWNNLVDVDFNLTAPAGIRYRVQLEATCADGTKSFTATTFATDPVVTAGQNRMTWDFGRDYPNVRAKDMQVTVSVVPYSDAESLYLVVDLSAGPEATSYPVRFTSESHGHVQGAVGETCQTTELWLKRIAKPARTLVYHNWRYEGANAFYGKQTKDFYVGVFEVTQRQFELVMGSNPSYFTNPACYACRPVENVVASRDLYGANANVRLHPDKITAGSFFGRLRARTGLPFIVPNSMQMEWAIRGGDYGGEYYRYKIDGKEPLSTEISRCSGNNAYETATQDSDLTVGTAAVGSYLPNMFGLYDTMGNVYEMVSDKNKNWASREMSTDLAALREAAGDPTLGTTADNPLIDYDGLDDTTASYRIMGGCWTKTVSLWVEGWYTFESGTWNNNSGVGFRVSMDAE